MSNLKPTGHVQPRTASNVLCSQLPYYHGGSSSRPSGWPSPRHSPITQQQLDISPIQYFFTHCRPGKSKDWIPMTGHGSSDAFSVVLISVDRECGKPIEKFVKKKKGVGKSRRLYSFQLLSFRQFWLLIYIQIHFIILLENITDIQLNFCLFGFTNHYILSFYSLSILELLNICFCIY